MNKSIGIKNSFDFQCDFSFDFAWQDKSSFVLHAGNCSGYSFKG